MKYLSTTLSFDPWMEGELKGLLVNCSNKEWMGGKKIDGWKHLAVLTVFFFEVFPRVNFSMMILM